jgi:hypothetical protein
MVIKSDQDLGAETGAVPSRPRRCSESWRLAPQARISSTAQELNAFDEAAPEISVREAQSVLTN